MSACTDRSVPRRSSCLPVKEERETERESGVVIPCAVVPSRWIAHNAEGELDMGVGVLSTTSLIVENVCHWLCQCWVNPVPVRGLHWQSQWHTKAPVVP